MPKEIKLLDDLILLMNNGTALLTGSKHDRGLNFLAGMLIGRAFNSLWRAREDLLCGYPVQSMALCRAALEDWTTLIWAELHPDRVDMFLWAILSEVDRPAGPPPKYDAMWKELGDLGKIPSVMYDSLSKFAHPKSVGLRWLIDFDPEVTNFHYGGHFDEQYLRVALFHLIQVAQAFGERVARLQFRMLGKVDPEWLLRGESISRTAIRTIDEMYDEFGRGKSGRRGLTFLHLSNPPDSQCSITSNSPERSTSATTDVRTTSRFDLEPGVVHEMPERRARPAAGVEQPNHPPPSATSPLPPPLPPATLTLKGAAGPSFPLPAPLAAEGTLTTRPPTFVDP